MKLLTLILLLGALFLQACTFAPLSSNYSARSLGEDKLSLQVGAAANADVPFLRFGYGLGKNTDIGILAEEQWGESVVGLWGKYAFVNSNEGVSFSTEGSLGGSANSAYFYVGPTFGYKFNWWEPYVMVRYNYVNNNKNHDIDLGSLGKHQFHDKHSFHYGLITAGNTLWINKWLGLNLNANGAFGEVALLYLGAGLIIAS